MISSNELRPGTTFKVDKDIFKVIDYTHKKQARGSAVVTTKLRNILTGATVNKTFRGGEKLEPVRIENRPMQFLYEDGEFYHFMDQETFDQIQIAAADCEYEKGFMVEEMIINIQMYDEKPIGIDLPLNVELKVEYTEPGLKGDTASGATKHAEMETGLRVNVPLFIEIGEMLRIDTRTKQYVERVK